MKRSQRKAASLPYAIRSFLGHLEGTEKARHTVLSYRSDLATFEEFLKTGLGSKPVRLEAVSRDDLERFHDWLKAQGLKTNSRRRKLLTVRKLLRYLTSRKKIEIDVGQKLPTPHKIERIPVTVESEALLKAIRELPVENALHARNRVLLWTLAETGCLVSEVTKLRFEQFSGASLSFLGKSARSVPVSRELGDAVEELRALVGEAPWLFHGFNKFGSLGSPITSRGVELLVKAYVGRLKLGELTPRTFRHSAVLRWHREGLTREQIRERLGLRTDYAFRVYDPLLKAAGKGSTVPDNRA